MLDIKFIRENPDAVKENIKKKFQEQKLPLVDQVLELDAENRRTIQEAQELRTARNAKSKQVGVLMGQSKKDPSKLQEAEEAKAKVKANADRLAELEAQVKAGQQVSLVDLAQAVHKEQTEKKKSVVAQLRTAPPAQEQRKKQRKKAQKGSDNHEALYL